MFRIFIENDHDVDDTDKNVLSELFGIEYEDLIDQEFVGVRGYSLIQRRDLFQAICDADEIFISTSFIGDSANLFTDMLIGAINSNLENKVVINMHEYRSYSWHLEKHHRVLMAHLQKQGIRFISGDQEIIKYLNAKKRAERRAQKEAAKKCKSARQGE